MIAHCSIVSRGGRIHTVKLISIWDCVSKSMYASACSRKQTTTTKYKVYDGQWLSCLCITYRSVDGKLFSFFKKQIPFPYLCLIQMNQVQLRRKKSLIMATEDRFTTQNDKKNSKLNKRELDEKKNERELDDICTNNDSIKEKNI